MSENLTVPDRPIQPEAADQLRELAHELRNPLNALSAVAEIFRDERFGELPNDEYRRYADLAFEATRRMIGLCDRLVVDPDAAVDPIESRARRASEVVSSVVDFFGPMATERGVQLNLQIKESLGDLMVDGDLLTSALNNLISNSIKFTPSGGRVSVIAEHGAPDDVLVLVISDRGVGIDPETLSRAMVEKPKPKVTLGLHGDKGSGMGLFMVRRGLEMVGGSLDIQSKPGLGTTATLRMPIHA